MILNEILKCIDMQGTISKRLVKSFHMKYYCLVGKEQCQKSITRKCQTGMAYSQPSLIRSVNYAMILPLAKAIASATCLTEAQSEEL